MGKRKPLSFAVAAIFAGISSLTVGAPPKPFDFEVKPWIFDPADTALVSSKWIEGLGCPTSTVVFPYPYTAVANYNDPGCPTSSVLHEDKKGMGLLLGKTGPTDNNAAGGATIKKVEGIILTQVGYDIRNGSHCGAGAPRFNIVTTSGLFCALGCNSPPADSTTPGTDWSRKKWGDGSTEGSVMSYCHDGVAWSPAPIPIMGTIKSIDIVFDEGTDQGPGIAILDNININGTLRGN